MIVRRTVITYSDDYSDDVQCTSYIILLSIYVYTRRRPTMCVVQCIYVHDINTLSTMNYAGKSNRSPAYVRLCAYIVRVCICALVCMCVFMCALVASCAYLNIT